MQQIKNFKNVKVILGQSPPSKSYNDSEDGLPFLQGKAEFGMIYPTPEKYTSSPLKIAEKNDILISVRAPVGDVNLAPYKLCIGRGLAALKITKDDPRFYFYWFQLNQKLIENMGTGSTFKAITGEQIKKIELPIVNLPEQKAIAEILSTVDEAIQKADEAIKKTERIKQGVMHKLLTEGIGHKEFKQTKIGKIPKEWEVKSIKEIISSAQNGFASGKRDEDGIVQIRMNNLTTDGRLVFDSYLKVPKIKNFEKYILKEKDLLVNNTNSIDLVGKSIVFKDAPFPCVYSNHFTCLRFNENINPNFILQNFIKLWQRKYFQSIAIRHVGQAAVNNYYLLKTRLAIPPLSEQNKIVGLLTQFNEALELKRNRKQKLQRIKLGLMNELLTGKKRVRLN